MSLLQSIRTWASTETVNNGNALAAAANRIVTASPRARLYDATFPDHELHFFNDCRIVCTRRLPDAEAQFFDTFHAPQSLKSIQVLSVDLTGTENVADAPLWIYVGDVGSALEACALLSKKISARLLFRASPEQKTLLARLPLDRFYLIEFRAHGDGSQAIYGLIPFSVRRTDPVANAALTRRRVGDLDFRRMLGAARATVAVVACNASIPQRSVITLAARQLVNDGKYRCEFQGSNSWLPMGSEPILRICLGRFPMAVQAIAVRFAPLSRHKIFHQDLRFQINGTSAEHTTQLGDQGNVYNIPLSDRSGSGVVLGVTCRSRAPANGRVVSARIQQVDLIT